LPDTEACPRNDHDLLFELLTFLAFRSLGVGASCCAAPANDVEERICAAQKAAKRSSCEAVGFAVSIQTRSRPVMMPSTLVLMSGVGRSGSTLLSAMLGNHPDCFNAGELNFLFESEDVFCGCGARPQHCAIWGRVLRAVSDQMSPALRKCLWNGGTPDFLRLKALPQMLAHSLVTHPDSRRWGDLSSEYVARLFDAANSIAATIGAKFVVDASKLSQRALLVVNSGQTNIRVIHLVRDPRAVAYSWTTRKSLMRPEAEAKFMGIYPVWHSAARYVIQNLLSEISVRKAGGIRVRYEDLVIDPCTVVKRILAHLGLEASGVIDAIKPGKVRLAHHHAIGGNPGLRNLAEVPLTPDTRFLLSLRRWHWVLCTTLCLPLILRYGYALTRQGARTLLQNG
jgi:hypothetical protein